MSILFTSAGCLIILIVLWDAFEAIILPRRVMRRVRLTRLFYLYTWIPLSALARRMRSIKRREKYLGFFGPLSLIMLLSLWAFGLVVGFAMIHKGLQIKVGTPGDAPGAIVSFGTYLYMSGVTFFTLGFGDLVPLGSSGRFLAVMEAGMGFGFLAIVIGYLPVLYQAFSRREVNISLLDARAGSPSSAGELLRRHAECGGMEELTELLREWERWSAELMESHLSYPVLSYFRSQH
ncbi:MAG TPA: potassium channel family protein, partial [Pyrinomonadaceae bacterium]|nr:potassium channel family protein [Pyrinomonadaceae bacterium]